MTRAFLYFLMLLQLSSWALAAQPALLWSRTFVSREGNINSCKAEGDGLGHTWLQVDHYFALPLPDLSLQYHSTGRDATAMIRLNRQGRADYSLHLSSREGSAYVKDFDVAPDHELWLLGYFTQDLLLTLPKDSGRLRTDRLRLFLAVVGTDGRLRLLLMPDRPYSGEDIDLAFDRKGRCHATVPCTEQQTTLVDGIRKTTERHLLQHLVWNRQGQLMKADTLLLSSRPAHNMNASRIHITQEDEVYIGTTYTEKVLLNGRQILEAPTPAGDYHAVLLHFDSSGRFTWHRNVSGCGNQIINSIASDAANVYISGGYSHECYLSQDNRIGHLCATPTTYNCIFLAGMSHGGQLRWTRFEATENASEASVYGRSLKTDGQGRLLAFTDYTEYLRVRGRDRDFILDGRREPWKHMPAILVLDTAGEVLDVRQDLVEDGGWALTLHAAARGDTFVVCGPYSPAMTGGSPRTDIRVRIGGKEGAPFTAHPAGGIYIYSFLDKPPREDTLSYVSEVPTDSGKTAGNRPP